MKLLVSCELDEAESIVQFLEEKGILAHTSSKYSRRYTAHLKTDVWVVLESQYKDALACLNDKDYVPITALKAGELVKLKSQSANLGWVFFKRLLVRLSLFVLCLSFIIIFLVKDW